MLEQVKIKYLTGYQLTLYPEILGRVAILLALHIIGME